MTGRKPTRKRTHQLSVIRKAMGLSVQKFAEPLGISRQYLDDIELGERRLNADLIRKIQDVYGISPNELLGAGAPENYNQQEQKLLKLVKELDASQQSFLMSVVETLKKTKK